MEQPLNFEQFLDYCPDHVDKWAELLGISRQAIQEHRKNGNFVVEGQSVRNGLAVAFGYMRDTAAGRVKTEGNEALVAAKVDDLITNTQFRKQKMAMLANELLPKKEVTDLISNVIITFRQQLEMSFPENLAQEINVVYQVNIPPSFIKENVLKSIVRTAANLRAITSTAN